MHSSPIPDRIRDVHRPIARRLRLALIKPHGNRWWAGEHIIEIQSKFGACPAGIADEMMVRHAMASARALECSVLSLVWNTRSQSSVQADSSLDPRATLYFSVSGVEATSRPSRRGELQARNISTDFVTRSRITPEWTLMARSSDLRSADSILFYNPTPKGLRTLL
jgi:hypothetical protein